MALGNLQYVTIKREASRGVVETTGFVRGIPWEDFSVYRSIASQFKDESADGTVSGLQNTEITGWIADGTIKQKMDCDNVLWALAGAFGTATPTTALGATTWAMSVVNSNLLPTHTIQTSRGDDGFRAVRGASIDKFGLSVGIDDATYSCDLKGLEELAGTVQTPSIPKASRVLKGFNWTTGFATTKAGLSSATTLAKVKSFDFELMNNIAGEEQYLGSLYRDDVPAGVRTATLKLSVTLSSTNGLETQFEQGSKLAFKLDGLASNLAVIGTSALKPRLTIELPPSLIKKSYKVERGAEIMYDLEVEVEQAALITAVLINSLPTLQ